MDMPEYTWPNRTRALNWLTGRMTDAELAEFSGLAQRAVGIVLQLPKLRSDVMGGGRGARHSRRIGSTARNALAVIHAMSQAGMTFELAANIISAGPVLAGSITELVDYSAPFDGVCALGLVDPQGGWLPTDIVPQPAWNRFIRPCRKAEQEVPGYGDISYLDADLFRPNQPDGSMFAKRPMGDTVHLVPLTSEPVYGGLLDPLGWYLPGRTEATERFDEKLLIADGRFVFWKQPDPSPSEAFAEMMQGQFHKGKPVMHHIEPVGIIEADGKTFRPVWFGKDDAAADAMPQRLAHTASLLEINMTFAVRRMKRRALGVEQGE